MLDTKLHLRTGLRMIHESPRFIFSRFGPCPIPPTKFFVGHWTKFLVSGPPFQENSTDNEEIGVENTFEIIWIAPFEDCDWFNEDFIFEGILNQC